MKSNLDLSPLTLSQLLELQDQLPKEIEKRRKAGLAEARRQIEQIAAGLGLPLDQIISTPISGKVGMRPPMYSHPEDERTWSGMGRKPAWISELEAKGYTLDKLRIDGEKND
jgi:DNA-binding protein H-NS